MTIWAITRAEEIFLTFEPDQIVFPNCTVELADSYVTPRCSHLSLSTFEEGEPYGILGYYGIVPCDNALNNPADRELFCRKISSEEIDTLYDPMGASSVLVSLIGLWLSLLAEPSFRRMSKKLIRDGIVEWNSPDEIEISTLTFKISIFCGFSLGILCVVWSLGWHHAGLPSGRLAWEHFASSIVISMLAGYRLGALSVMGYVARKILRRASSLKLIVGHADGMGGARSIGDFLAVQGIVAAILPVWLSSWVVLQWQFPSIFWAFNHWLPMHVGMLLVSLLLFWFGFGLPAIFVTKKYRQERSHIIDNWTSRFSEKVMQENATFLSSKKIETALESFDFIKSANQVSESLNKMASVPMSLGVRSLFSVGSATPILTFVFGVIAPPESKIASYFLLLFEMIANTLGTS